jgi:hypothetical protein
MIHDQYALPNLVLSRPHITTPYYAAYFLGNLAP